MLSSSARLHDERFKHPVLAEELSPSIQSFGVHVNDDKVVGYSATDVRVRPSLPPGGDRCLFRRCVLEPVRRPRMLAGVSAFSVSTRTEPSRTPCTGNTEKPALA
jgi:hypothetical protein